MVDAGDRLEELLTSGITPQQQAAIGPLPQGRGLLEATRRLKADPQTRGILVYAFTALAMKRDEGRAREAGCDGYIPKPIRITELIQRVKEALSPSIDP